jgi:uncharacterized membrane protein YhaH (DUF805 family)
VGSLAAGAATGFITAILELAARSSGHSTVEPIALSVKQLTIETASGWWLVWQSLIVLLAVILIVVAIAIPKEQAPLCGWHERGRCPISIWLFVEIGFLRGRQGPNRFGPDPLDANEGRRPTLSHAPSNPRCRSGKRLYRAPRSRVPHHGRAEQKSG